MKVALFGYGAMGKLVETLVAESGDEIGLKMTSADASLAAADVADKLNGHDVAIDFSVAGAVPRNAGACAIAGVPLVEGTTGWSDQLEQVTQVVTEKQSALVYGANFSVGVNIFYRVVAQVAKLMSAVDQYQGFIEEEHHARKRDAPSGTALKLKDLMSQYIAAEIPVASLRAGYIPGTHRVGFDSVADQILLTHTARSRQGFAAGALVAARWIIGKRGVYEFSQVMDEIIET
jgi:4-hydroxy-tetrahydrodipicolinate reductase